LNNIPEKSYLLLILMDEMSTLEDLKIHNILELLDKLKTRLDDHWLKFFNFYLPIFMKDITHISPKITNSFFLSIQKDGSPTKQLEKCQIIYKCIEPFLTFVLIN
jgi:hypothetical protein